jgi:hypothetical protein
MITLPWNCRGLAQASTIRSLRAMIRKHNPDILFLSETKVSPLVSTPILRQLGFSLMTHAPPSGSKGGLLLAWRTDVNIVCFHVSCNIICVWHYADDPCIKCLLVYGPPYKNLCVDFWNAMDAFGASYNDPWICIGDFNAIISPNDKLGGRPFDSYSSNPFTDFMDGYGMVDLGFCENPYTWSNHRQGSSLIKERLDRGIANSSWITSFPSYSVVHLPAHTSDHSPLLLNSNSPVQSLPRPFRFEAFWTWDPTCGIVIDEAWSTLIAGSPAFCLSKKLKITKDAIKYWNKHYFGHIKHKLDTTLSLLDKVQQASPSDPNLAMELHLQKLLAEYLKQEESLWKTKSRELWLTASDLNTRFFHTSTLIRQRRNSISFLQTPNGGWLSDQIDIGNCFVNSFKQLFTSTAPPSYPEFLDLFHPVFSDLDNLSLCSIPGEAEIFEALLSLGREKAPCPDGFTALFYVKYWDCIKSTVLLAIGKFFTSNALLREQNHTFITLVPKKLGPSMVHHFRPISLCNIIYKIISKILANRLKPLLSKFISPFQTAFVLGRHIQDNSILSHEMLHSLKSKRGRGGLMAVNIDMEKAFDKMEWELLLIIMEKMGFKP